jgi:hypothetical protein
MKHPYSGGFSISALMSETLQQEILGPNFVCGGYLPDLTPAHQVLLETGMMAGMGGSAFASPIIWGNRRKPISGKVGFDLSFPIRSASMRWILALKQKKPLPSAGNSLCISETLISISEALGQEVSCPVSCRDFDAQVRRILYGTG